MMFFVAFDGDTNDNNNDILPEDDKDKVTI